MALGVVHPDYLLGQLNARQLAEWEAYSTLEPFGERHRDFHFGRLGALMANAWFGNDKKQFEPKDFRVLSRWDFEDERLEELRRKPNDEAAIGIIRSLKKED